jgi:hypothetical protein
MAKLFLLLTVEAISVQAALILNTGPSGNTSLNIACFTRKTAVEPQHRRQVRDRSGVSTAAQFTQWVTTAFAANTCG